MLKVMRKHARYFYVLFVLVILSFIFWGVGGVDNSETLPLAEVGDEKIAVEEYWRSVDRMTDLYRDVYKEKFDESMMKTLRDNVLESMITQRVLFVAARRAGIEVSDAELQDSITNDKTFARDGAFDRGIYLRTLELSRMTPQYYEAVKRRDLMAEKMRRLIEEAVDLGPDDLKDIKGEKDGENLKSILIQAKREAAVASYVNGLKKQINIKINKELIEGEG